LTSERERPAEQIKGPIEGEEGVPDVDWASLTADLAPSAYRAVRGALDPFMALILLVILLPVLAVIAVVIKLDSDGPVFFRQVRAGRFARPFTMIKFRTMYTDAPPSSLKMPDGSRMITRAGDFLRRTGLDELPNLVNVIGGKMALVGPRPEQYDLLCYYRPWQHERHLIKPGITGWWQVHHRGSEPMHLNIDKDVYYVRNQSLLLDLRIVARTARLPLIVLSRVPVIRLMRSRLDFARRWRKAVVDAKPSAGE
jgi:lipopolysaccharide/colanic/teichoic acid biosynthesis glycosyltransferase